MEDNKPASSLFAKNLETAKLPHIVMGFIGETVCEMISKGSMNKSSLLYYLENKKAYLDPQRDWFEIAKIDNAISHLNGIERKKYL